jgi:hypothetical protein
MHTAGIIFASILHCCIAPLGTLCWDFIPVEVRFATRSLQCMSLRYGQYIYVASVVYTLARLYPYCTNGQPSSGLIPRYRISSVVSVASRCQALMSAISAPARIPYTLTTGSPLNPEAKIERNIFRITVAQARFCRRSWYFLVLCRRTMDRYFMELTCQCRLNLIANLIANSGFSAEGTRSKKKDSE